MFLSDLATASMAALAVVRSQTGRGACYCEILEHVENESGDPPLRLVHTQAHKREGGDRKGIGWVAKGDPIQVGR